MTRLPSWTSWFVVGLPTNGIQLCSECGNKTKKQNVVTVGWVIIARFNIHIHTCTYTIHSHTYTNVHIIDTHTQRSCEAIMCNNAHKNSESGFRL